MKEAPNSKAADFLSLPTDCQRRITIEKDVDSSDYCDFDASVEIPAWKPVRVLYSTQMGLLCIVLVSRNSDVESIEAGVDCDFRDYCCHLQSDFPILYDTGYVGYLQRSDYRTGCGFIFALKSER